MALEDSATRRRHSQEDVHSAPEVAANSMADVPLSTASVNCPPREVTFEFNMSRMEILIRQDGKSSTGLCTAPEKDKLHPVLKEPYSPTNLLPTESSDTRRPFKFSSISGLQAFSTGIHQAPCVAVGVQVTVPSAEGVRTVGPTFTQLCC